LENTRRAFYRFLLLIKKRFKGEKEGGEKKKKR